ncbi:general odorant-binding protein 72-like [Rhynchophorus ferrugineus]|uniref:Odorant binding protein 8 n=1 Tax=Rhynchophorus ferrugineus TaxID=354439 RepID=A0A1C8JYW3_RHYFE|nr:odorant binding protein 8 [Rhynchophorus ferrugineus]KAF7279946.1 hypothetical protein GWI33_006572 [Rhynchophorus ferrugineus]
MGLLFFFLTLLILSINNGDCAMSEAQVKAAKKLVRNACIPKSKVTEEQVDGMHDGMWDLDKRGKCYLQCVMNFYKLQKPDNTLDWEAGIKMMETQAPPSLAPHGIKCMKECKDAAKTLNEKCTAAFEIAKCIYDIDPAQYFWP